MNGNRIVILGADERQRKIYEILKIKYSAAVDYTPEKPYCEKDGLNGEFVILPTVATKDGIHINLSNGDNTYLKTDEFISSLKRHTHLITGIGCDKIRELCIKRQIYLYEYAKDEAFKLLNAVPTAEGAIALAIENTATTLWRSKCLIIGNGCIGKSLSVRLAALGADVTVSARKPEDFAYLDVINIRHIETEKAYKEIAEYNIIFNTVPKRILSNEVLKTLNPSTLFIDLASAPFGIDFNAMNEYPFKALKAGSLPAKFSPITAAELAAKAICEIIEKVSNNG